MRYELAAILPQKVFVLPRCGVRMPEYDSFSGYLDLMAFHSSLWLWIIWHNWKVLQECCMQCTCEPCVTCDTNKAIGLLHIPTAEN